MRLLLKFSLCFTLVYASACSLTAEEATHAQQGDEFLDTRAWECDPLGYVVTSQKPDSDDLWVFLPGQTRRLNPISPGQFAAQGLSAELSPPVAQIRVEDTTSQCRENRPASIQEDAKLRGVDYWGTGQEPPWRLEIGPELLLLKTGYENQRHEFATPEPVSDPQIRTTVYTAENGANRITVRIEGKPCSDSMSGQPFSSSVTVQLDDVTLRGCGRALH